MAIMTFPPAMFVKIPAVVSDAYESDGYIDFGMEELKAGRTSNSRVAWEDTFLLSGEQAFCCWTEDVDLRLTNQPGSPTLRFIVRIIRPPNKRL